jgi:hypothetical protein
MHIGALGNYLFIAINIKEKLYSIILAHLFVNNFTYLFQTHQRHSFDVFFTIERGTDGQVA